MKKPIVVALFLLGSLMLVPTLTFAQEADAFEARVESFVCKHYLDGIQYVDAKALGSGAIPYLVEMLSDPGKKPYWVNIIVTMGFVEDSSALDVLVAHLERPQGPVDDFAFRALLSIPFAIGCIAGNGDPEALRYLTDLVETPFDSPWPWSFQGQNCRRLLAEQATIGLAISGRAEARTKLLAMEKQITEEGPASPRRFLIGQVQAGLEAMDRIASGGKASVFNPRRTTKSGGSRP
jgi:hypothetical protein